MSDPALGEAVCRLPWLSPAAASLVTLARPPKASVWEMLRDDPGAVQHIVRYATAPPSGVASFPHLLHGEAILVAAARHLDGSASGFVDWRAPAARSIYQGAVAYARTARHLAQRTGRADPESAGIAGLLAPLGWLAVCALDATAASACLTELDADARSLSIQQRRWGLDQAAIARRLSRRWQLPGWLAAVVGCLDMPVATAQFLGADPDLFRVVQLAVLLVQRHHGALHLLVGASAAELTAELGLAGAELDEAGRAARAALDVSLPAVEWTDPHSMPLLRDLLRTAAENRRLSEAPILEQLENDADRLHQALASQQAGEELRLRTLQLGALAELAAGAGHEINNPLAVISGQAQYLLHHETEPARQRTLHTIVGQARRIHEILTDLMMFARPSRPQKQPFDAAALAPEVAAALADLADQRRVRLTVQNPNQPVELLADPRQMRNALVNLVRNGIEAAPADGWVRIRLEMLVPDRLEWVVEDSGDGPGPLQRDHLFDPFYSGRPAGRGRGMGLPTAWRLAHEHGGEVRFEPLAGGPTRFVLSLPRRTATTPETQAASSDGFMPSPVLHLNGDAPANHFLPLANP